MKTKSLGFIGGGRITRILLQGFKQNGLVFSRIVVAETNQSVINALKHKFPEIKIDDGDLRETMQNDIVFIALHPPMVMEILPKIRALLGMDTLLVSLAPKITLEKMRGLL